MSWRKRSHVWAPTPQGMLSFVKPKTYNQFNPMSEGILGYFRHISDTSFFSKSPVFLLLGAQNLFFL